MAQTFVISQNTTITSSGSFLATTDEDQEMVLFWNITGPVTGTNPTLQFTMQEVDPSDEMTPNGSAIISSIITSVNVGNLILSLINSSRVVVSWAVTGTNPSFGGFSLIAISKASGNTIATGSVPTKSLYDLSSSSVTYIGTAPTGTLTRAAAWLIKKISFDASGNPTSTLWSSYTAVWDNRSNEQYN